MSLSLTPRITYIIGAGDSDKKEFDFRFPILDKNDLKVITSNGVELRNYTVQIYKDRTGGKINLLNSLAVGTKITIYRDMNYTRQTLFRENEDFRASVINEEFDRIIMLLQQAGLQSKDSIRTPLSDNQMDMVLPTASMRANSVLGFDNTGRTKTYKDIAQSSEDAKRYSVSAKNSADNANRDRVIVDNAKTDMQNNYLKKDLSNFQNNLAKNDLSNVNKSDFKTKYDELGVKSGSLPTKIFTQTSGKFFTRKADGSLPTGIDASKVWSLTDQSTAKGGTMPVGKNHIELPVGDVMFSVAGAGGGGGHNDYDGSSYGQNGGTSSVSNIISGGGIGGASTRLKWKVNHTGNGRGGAGGIGSWEASYKGQNGSNGDFKQKTINLSAGQVLGYIIGAGGAGGSGGRFYTGGDGKDGYIEVEYA